MNQHDPPAPSRAAWLRINADGVLLAMLAFIAGIDLFDPQYSDIARDVGYVPPTFYLWTSCYFVGGALMLGGFIWQRMLPELAGRLLLCLGFLMETVRTASLIGWLHHDLLVNYLVGAVLITVCGIRAGALLSRKGLTIVIGGRS